MNEQDLRNSILQLAIQGKLVEQREEEGTSKELLEWIRVEKEKFIKDNKISKEKDMPKIGDDEIPFDIPDSWEWVRISDLALFIKAGGDKPKDFTKEKTKTNTVPVISNGFQNDGITGFTELATIEESCITVSGRGTIGFSCIRREPFTPIVRLLVLNISKNISQEYIQIVLTVLLERGVGTSIKQLTIPMIRPKLIPIPPLEEQKRIVAKIQELMPYAEKYGEAYSKVEGFNKKFPEDMQKSILQYAIQGKLVEQREEEGTAEELYKQIQEEKGKLIKEGKIKKEKPLSKITDIEIPFDIPESWKWVRLGDIFNLTMGQSPKGKNVFEDEKGFEFHQGKVFFGEDYIQESNKSTNKPTRIVEPDTVLLCVRAPVGIANITERKICIGRGLCGINTLANMNEKFVLYILRAFKNEFIKKATGTTFVAITVGVVKNQLIPLPPLAEQKRIVAKIEEILPYAKQLVK